MGGKGIGIVVDSTASIPDHLVEEYKIHVVPQNLNWADETLRDGVDITPEEFYVRLSEASELPTTSQPSTGEFYEYFQGLSVQYDSIVAIVISQHLSGTYSCASAASEMIGEYRIDVVDSSSASMGLGFVALEAARAVKRGASHDDVVAVAREMATKVRTVFVVDTLEYLHRGGRIGGAKRLFGTMLSIKPVLHLDGGRIEPLASVRTKRKAVQAALELVEKDVAGRGTTHVAIMHAAAPDEADALRAEVESRLKPKELYVTNLTPVVGTHTGPGLVGIAYFAEG
jgi:DegV family protein with EDD domain